MFGFALLLFQAYLLQTAFGQFACRSPFEYAPEAWASYGDFGYYGLTGPYGYGAFDFAGPYGYGAFDFTGPYGYGAFDFTGLFAGRLAELATGPVGAYGGAGVGEVAVAGDLPAGGATAVVGQVPILGAVELAGPVKAVGAVTISGTCGCGCGATFMY